MWFQSLAPFAGLVDEPTGAKERAACYGQQSMGTQVVLGGEDGDLLSLGDCCL